MRFIDISARREQLGVLDASPRIAVVFEHPLPVEKGCIDFAQGRLSFGQRHQRVAEIVSRVGRKDLLQQRLGIGGFPLSQEALPQVTDSVIILRIPLEGFSVAGLSLGQLATGEIHITQIGMVPRLVEVVDTTFEFLDSPTIGGTRQLETPQSESTGGASLLPIHHEVVEHRAEDAEEQDAGRPDPLFTAQGIHHHPKLESSPNEQQGIAQRQLHQILNQAEHSC